MIYMLYLDNAATTQVLNEVKDYMIEYLVKYYANSEVDYYDLGIKSKQAIEQARNHVARLVGCRENEVIFTSGATESNNMIIKGVVKAYKDLGNHIITTKVEHSSVLNVCQYLESEGYRVTYLDVDRFGRIKLEDLENAITENTILISIIWGNNELGTLNDIHSIDQLIFQYELDSKRKIFFHSDATQVVGKMDIDFGQFKALDFLSLSAHKFHGPKGVGSAILRSDEYGFLPKIEPLIHGGGQEGNYRSGTIPVHNIVGLGKAAEIAHNNLEINYNNLLSLEKRFIEILDSTIGKKIRLVYNSDTKEKVPGIINVQFEGIRNKRMLEYLSSKGIMASSGSACSISKPSHVLKAIGKNQKEIEESIRFSLSSYEDINNLDVLIEVFNI